MKKNPCRGWGFWIALKFSDEDIYIGRLVSKLFAFITADLKKYFHVQYY